MKYVFLAVNSLNRTLLGLGSLNALPSTIAVSKEAALRKGREGNGGRERERGDGREGIGGKREGKGRVRLGNKGRVRFPALKH